MSSGWTEPRWLVGAGVVLIAAGYTALHAAPTVVRVVSAAGLVAFYGGLVLLVVGIVSWLQRPPGPDPADEQKNVPTVEDD
jgi:predicted membrane channel-forming protein YqfA (hemolysin III family)